MQLYVTKPSPYARKAWAAVLELGLADKVEVVELPARMPITPKPELEAINPLGKVPALVADDGAFIGDSPVIVAYLDEMAGGQLIPSGPAKWRALTLEALADGCMDAGVVLRLESLKPERQQDRLEIVAHQDKIARSLDLIETEPGWLDQGFNVGGLALACAVDWIIFRDLMPDPEAGRPRLAAWLSDIRRRPSLIATRP